MMDIDQTPIPDPPSESDPAFVQLRSLASSSDKLLNSSKPTTPLFAHIKSLNRAASAAARARKTRTAIARKEMDETHLGLQNLNYERRHLEREIEKCLNFASIYQDIPLVSEEDFLRTAPEEMHTEDVLRDEHQLMLSRLSFELAERHRLDELKKELALKRELLMKESKEFTNSLNALGVQLDGMAKSSAEIQKKMHELAAPPPAPEPISEITETAGDTDVAMGAEATEAGLDKARDVDMAGTDRQPLDMDIVAAVDGSHASA